jgi:hypothetical protein
VAASGGEWPRSCDDCGSPLDSRQRYCLHCGQRVGPPGAQLAELQRRVREQPLADAPSAPRAAGAEPPQASRPAVARRRFSTDALVAGLSQTRLPSPRVSTLLVLAFAGFGVLLGSVAGSPVKDSLAAEVRRPIRLFLPAATTTTGGDEAAEAQREPPPAAEEATPEALAATPLQTPAPAPSPASSKTPKHGGGGGEQTPAAHTTPTKPKLPAIKHVFLIMLSDQPYAATFGPESKAPYLAHTLESRGELLARYYAVAHEQLANGIALLSGQGPTPSTAANCPVYNDVTPATPAADRQVAGDGCVYPPTIATLPGQLEVKQLTWRAYVQGIDEAGAAAPACAHPATGQADPSSPSPSSGAYATFRNPFVYFHGLVDSPTCASDDVGLGALSADLSSEQHTRALSYIVPDRCHDGSPGPCPGGGPGGLPAADVWLTQIVPKILASAAYKQGGLLLITSDEAPSSGEFADSSSCCGQPRYPNLPPPSGVAASLPAEGGGQVGALLLSPFVKPHTITQEPYNHYSLLRTIEDLFGLKHLGYANGAHVASLQPSLFAAKRGG